MKILTDLIAGWYRVDSRPRIVDAYIPHRYASVGAKTLTSIIFPSTIIGLNSAPDPDPVESITTKSGSE